MYLRSVINIQSVGSSVALYMMCIAKYDSCCTKIMLTPPDLCVNVNLSQNWYV